LHINAIEALEEYLGKREYISAELKGTIVPI